MQPNIPNTGQKTVRAYMRVKSFVSPDNPTPEQINQFDQDITKFLETVDNTKRFLNGRNSYAMGNKLYVLIWYLESIPDQPVVNPFGGATQVTTDKKDEQNSNTQQAENK